MTAPDKNSFLSEWLRPGVILQFLGFFALVVAAWQQIAQNAKDIENNRDWIKETRSDVRDINSKLDRLIERRP